MVKCLQYQGINLREQLRNMLRRMAVPQFSQRIFREFLVQNVNKPQAAEQGYFLFGFSDGFFARVSKVFPQDIPENP